MNYAYTYNQPSVKKIWYSLVYIAERAVLAGWIWVMSIIIVYSHLICVNVDMYLVLNTLSGKHLYQSVVSTKCIRYRFPLNFRTHCMQSTCMYYIHGHRQFLLA